MKLYTTKSTLINLDKQDIEEAIAEFIQKKHSGIVVVKGDIEFLINVHEQDKLKGAKLEIEERTIT
jgi:hypothetical protein